MFQTIYSFVPTTGTRERDDQHIFPTSTAAITDNAHTQAHTRVVSILTIFSVLNVQTFKVLDRVKRK